MRIQLRIVSGSLRGRKVSCIVSADIRPTPDMVRQALFNLLRDVVQDRPFFDVFAGSGAVGMEAISRGASQVVFIERDFRLAENIEQHLKTFGVADRARVLKTDAYRWAERWLAPAEPVNVFLSPPFADFQRRLDGLMQLVGELQRKVAPESVIVLQTEEKFNPDELPDGSDWELRRYGRNQLLILVKKAEASSQPTDQP